MLWDWALPGGAAGGTQRRGAAEGRGLEALAGWARSVVLPPGAGVLRVCRSPSGSCSLLTER